MEMKGSRTGPRRKTLEGGDLGRGSGPSLVVSSPSLASSSDKALTSFSREARDSWICRSISLSLAPTWGVGEEGEGRREDELDGAAPCWPGARRGWLVKGLAHAPAQLPPAPACEPLRLAPAWRPV